MFLFIHETLTKVIVTKNGKYIGEFVLNEDSYNRSYDILFNINHGSSKTIYSVDKRFTMNHKMINYVYEFNKKINNYFFDKDLVDIEAVKEMFEALKYIDKQINVYQFFYNPKTKDYYMILDKFEDIYIQYRLEPNNKNINIIVYIHYDGKDYIFNVLENSLRLPKKMDSQHYLRELLPCIYTFIENQYELKDKAIFDFPDWLVNSYEKEYLKII